MIRQLVVVVVVLVVQAQENNNNNSNSWQEDYYANSICVNDTIAVDGATGLALLPHNNEEEAVNFWLQCHTNLGCSVDAFCTYSHGSFDGGSRCTKCPTIDECDQVPGVYHPCAIEQCKERCNFAQPSQFCNQTVLCVPGQGYCNFENGLNGTCQPCNKQYKSTNDLTMLADSCNHLNNELALESCYECDLKCLPAYDIQIENFAHKKSKTFTIAMVPPEQFTGVDQSATSIWSFAVEGSPFGHAGVENAPLADCSILNNVDLPNATCPQGRDSVCLIETHHFVLHQVILRAQAQGCVATLIFMDIVAEPLVTATDIFAGYVEFYASSIPSLVILNEVGVELKQHYIGNQVNLTYLDQYCKYQQSCLYDKMPCIGKEQPPLYPWRQYCNTGMCSACPFRIDPVSKQLDLSAPQPFLCFFQKDGWYRNPDDIKDCAHSCAADLQFDSNCKLCPQGLTGASLEFGGLDDPNDKCLFCPETEILPHPDRIVGIFQHSCRQVNEFFMTVDLHKDSQPCRLAQSQNYICGCTGGPGYGGANTLPKQLVLVWLPRCMAILSLLGSLYIVIDIVQERDRRKKVFNQLMLVLSVFDMIGALAYAFTSLPIPTEDYIHGAAGNAASCSTQAFFIQVGTISCYTNVSLAVYYLLIIKYGWSEHRIKKIRHWLFTCPIVVGMFFAFAGIPFYDNVILWCNNSASWWPDIPVAIAIAVATIVMAIVCWDVYEKERASARWRGGLAAFASSNHSSGPHHQQSSNMTRSFIQRSFRRSNDNNNNARAQNQLSMKVFWQAFWYLMVFYLTWPAYLALQYSWASGRALTNYGLILTAGIMAPLQGFWNCLVYVRPRYLKKRDQRARQNTTSTSTGRSGGTPIHSTSSTNRSSRALFASLNPMRGLAKSFMGSFRRSDTDHTHSQTGRFSSVASTAEDQVLANAKHESPVVIASTGEEPADPSEAPSDTTVTFASASLHATEAAVLSEQLQQSTALAPIKQSGDGDTDDPSSDLAAEPLSRVEEEEKDAADVQDISATGAAEPVAEDEPEKPSGADAATTDESPAVVVAAVQYDSDEQAADVQKGDAPSVGAAAAAAAALIENSSTTLSSPFEALKPPPSDDSMGMEPPPPQPASSPQP